MKPGQIKRGFKPLAAQIEGKEKYIADCTSCVDWSDNDGCENPNVLKYDMVDDGNRTYCTYWSNKQRKGNW